MSNSVTPFDHRVILLAYFSEIAEIEGNTWEAWAERNRLLGKCQSTIDAAILEVMRDESKLSLTTDQTFNLVWEVHDATL